MNNDAQEDTIALIRPRSALLNNNKTLRLMLEYLPIKDMNKIKVIFKQRQFYEE